MYQQPMPTEQAFSHILFGQARDLILLSGEDIPAEYRETFGRWYEELADSRRARWEVRNDAHPLVQHRQSTDVSEMGVMLIDTSHYVTLKPTSTK